MVKSDKTANEVIVELSRKIKCEMKQFSSLDFDSVLKLLHLIVGTLEKAVLQRFWKG